MNDVRNEERTEEKGQEKNTKRLETIKKRIKSFTGSLLHSVELVAS